MDLFNYEKTERMYRSSNPFNIGTSLPKKGKPFSSINRWLQTLAVKFSRLLPKFQRQIDLDFGDDSNLFGG